MKLPALADPPRYVGLYIFDFGDHVSVGYTAREIAFLLESEEYRQGRAYKIHRASADGTLEIRGVVNAGFHAEETMIFIRGGLRAAQADFEDLLVKAADRPPPCPVRVQLVLLSGGPQGATALTYPAENSPELGWWLNQLTYEGGDRVESGTAAALHERVDRTVSARVLYPPPARTSRSREEVLASTHLDVQR